MRYLYIILVCMLLGSCYQTPVQQVTVAPPSFVPTGPTTEMTSISSLRAKPVGQDLHPVYSKAR